jgi:hypothetical protein
MGFTTIKAGFTTAQTDGDGLRPVTGSPTQAQWEGTFKDIMQPFLYETLAGVIEGDVCTASVLDVTIPINTVYVAGGMVWKTLVGEVQAVTNDATTYIWGCADGELRVTSTTTPPTGFEGGKSCIIVKAVAASSVVTLDHSVQQKAMVAASRMMSLNNMGLFPSVDSIPSGAAATIPQNSQYRVFESFTNAGSLIIQGKLRIEG